MSELREIASGLNFPEGPIAMPDGSVLLVEIRRGTLSRVTPDGKISVVANCGGAPNGAAFGPDGAVYICNNGGFEWHDLGGMVLPGNQPADYIGGKIQRVDLASGKVEDLYTHCDGHHLGGPNYFVFVAPGVLCFTDHGKIRDRDRDRTGVYYAKPDGSMIEEVLFPLDAPNGVGLSPDGNRLYVAETYTGRVWVWDVTAPGAVAQAGFTPPGGTLLFGSAVLQYFDSLAVDSAGNVCVATILNSGISVIAADGHLVEHVSTPDPLTTNICFGGKDLRTAYITLSGTGRLLATEWKQPGLKLNYAP